MENVNGSNKPAMQHHPESSLSSDSSLDHSNLSPSPGASSPFPDVSSQMQQWSMMSNSPRADTGNSLLPDAFPPNLDAFPPNHPPGYDPNRIPKSIFSSKPTTPEWSTASNESLFSIQMGTTNSFSTDYSHLVNKSDELNKSEEWRNSPYYATEKCLPSALTPVIERDYDGKCSVMQDQKNVEMPKMVEKSPNNVVEEPPPTVPTTSSNRTDDKVAFHPTEATRASSPARASSPCHSEASGNSSSSFAFPVLVNDGATKSNSSKSTGAFEKVEKPQLQPEFQPEKPPQQQQQSSESPAKVAEKRWYSCFACWPRCC